jgi:hypothetical protein
VALKGNRDAGVLLNGAFTKHRRRERYRMSRGLVFLEIIHADVPVEHWGKMDLEDIEPFTLILFVNEILFECRWDGEQRYIRELDMTRPHIWTSVTLYDEAARADRLEMLMSWYSRREVTTGGVVRLHRQMKREGPVKTVSITNLRLGPRGARLRYIDLKERPVRRVSPLLIRLRSWEYWPFGVVYAPIFLYWVWLSLRARSIFFFSTANPTIKNSGFLLESKQQIYDLLPAGVYPKTVAVRKGSRIGDIRSRLAELGLTYPLMAKPDIGQRGMGVELLNDECGLLVYAMRSKVDFLLQEYVGYPMEIGVFYHRMPGEEKGTITGIVEKEFLTVTGDGVRTIGELLLQDDRYVLQLPVLRRTIGHRLQAVLPAGKTLELAPYGNHSRGAKFLDHSSRLNVRIEAVINGVCLQIPGFYFGRLDIRFQSWSLLEAGEAFSIIELNGAGSEPTHIYDPDHSVLFAWKEIVRHLDILYRVSRANRLRCGLTPMSFRQGLKMLRDYRRYEKLIG